MPSTDPLIWIGAIFVLMTLSFVYKNTQLFRFIEYTIVGASLGHTLVFALNAIRTGVSLVPRDPFQLVPILAGLMLFTRLHKTYYRLSWYPLALMVGVGTGLVMRATIKAQFIDQLTQSIVPLTNINNILIFVGTITVIVYFIFTVEAKGLLRHPSRIGLWFMMVMFGFMFGQGFIGRSTMIISALRYLLFDWLGIIP